MLTKDEPKKVLKHLAGLFPGQTTDEQAKWFIAKVREFDCADVTKAISAHRESPHVTASKGFIDWGQLIEGCRAIVKSRERVTVCAHREGSWADVYRRQRPELAEKKDVEVVMLVHRGWWNRCPQTEAYRQRFRRSCERWLVSFDVPAEAAARATETLFGRQWDFEQAVLDLAGGATAA